jgi:hypothetical protein
VTLPASPPANCEFTFAPSTVGFYLDFNGKTANLPGFVGSGITALAIPTLTYLVVDHYRTTHPSYSLQYDSNEWVESAVSSSIVHEVINPANVSQLVHGQVYFRWNSAVSPARFELCPQSGPGGLIVDGGIRQVPIDCLTLTQLATTSGVLNFFYAVHTDNDNPFVRGAADNGSGNIRLTFSSSVLGNPGDQVEIQCDSVGGAFQANVADAAEIVDSTHIDLLNTSSSGLGTYTSGGQCFIVRLEADTTGHITGANGVEIMNGNGHYSLVGIAHVSASNLVNDSPTIRDVASWFNRKVKTCVDVYTADHSVTATTSWGEPSSEIRCEFVVFDDPHENAKSWSITGMYGNNTVGDGTLVTAGFDGTTPEIEVAGEKGNNISLGVHGSKAGLSEGKHFITLLAKGIGGGASTIYGTTPATSLEIQVWQ